MYEHFLSHPHDWSERRLPVPGTGSPGGHLEHLHDDATPFLEGMGVEADWTNEFELADGRRERYPMAEVLLRINGQERTSICICGSANSQPILGTYALEGFGLTADPVNQRLVPATLFLA